MNFFKICQKVFKFAKMYYILSQEEKKLKIFVSNENLISKHWPQFDF